MADNTFQGLKFYFRLSWTSNVLLLVTQIYNTDYQGYYGYTS